MRRKLHILLILLVLPSTQVFSAEGKGTSVEADLMIRGEINIKDLITWELLRLKGLEGDPQIELPKNLEISQKIAAGLKLTEVPHFVSLSNLRLFLKQRSNLLPKEKEQLLGILRMANALLRNPEKESSTVFRDQTVDELKKIAARNPGKIALPKELADALDPILNEVNPGTSLKEGISAGDLAKVLANPKFNPKSIPEKDWAGLLGNVRAQSPKLRGDEFLGDFKADVWDDKFASLPKLDAGIEKPINPFKSFNRSSFSPNAVMDFDQTPSELNDSLPKSSQGGHSVPQVDLPALQRFIAPPPRESGVPVPPRLRNDFGEFGGQARGDGIAIDLGALGNGVGNISEGLKKKKAEGAFSLLMRTSYEGKPGAISSCQITLVKKEKRVGECKYTGATAKHCVRDEDRPSAKLTGMEIEPFTRMNHVNVVKDIQFSDFALVEFNSDCREDLPIVPLRKDPLDLNAENPPEILVDTVRGTLAGKAKDLVGGDSLVVMDVRTPENGGLGIYPGDSGGGVAALDKDGKLELVGVISSKPTDERLHGIGFFAAKGSMKRAVEYVEEGNKHGASLVNSTTH